MIDDVLFAKVSCHVTPLYRLWCTIVHTIFYIDVFSSIFFSSSFYNHCIIIIITAITTYNNHYDYVCWNSFMSTYIIKRTCIYDYAVVRTHMVTRYMFWSDNNKFVILCKVQARHTTLNIHVFVYIQCVLCKFRHF